MMNRRSVLLAGFAAACARQPKQVRIAAFQGQAFIQYSGFTTTQLRYDIHDGGNTALIFQQNLDKNSTIGIETTIAGPSRAQLLVLNLIW